MDTGRPLKNKIPSLAVWAITPNGLVLGKTLCAAFPGARLFVSESLRKESSFSSDVAPESEPGPKAKSAALLHHLEPRISPFKGLSQELALQFTRFSAHIFIFSTGIAVRMIAPLIQSKTTDPAVVVVDDKGLHAISLLSGHLGGANHLAKEIAGIIHAKAVITTATDINHLPSIDLLAQERNLFIENPEAIKHVNMVFLKGGRLAVHDPLNCLQEQIPQEFISGQGIPKTGTGVVCTWKTVNVPRETLVLRPRVLSVGMGCNRHTPVEIIQDLLMEVFKKEWLSLNSVYTLATTDLKKNEPGFLLLAERLGLPWIFYDNLQLNSVDTIQTPSLMVEKHIGVKSVCEAAAILAADRGRLIVPKQKNRDVTLAVALKK